MWKYVGKTFFFLRAGAPWASWLLSIFAFSGILFILSGGYDEALSWRDHRVTVRIDSSINVQNIASNLTPEDFRQINCLARNMYFEAANQGQIGMKAVGDVVFNRLKSGMFPDGVCQIVYQGTVDSTGKPVLNRCQFSWYCDGKQHVVTDQTHWAMAYEVAYNEYLYQTKMPDVTQGATYYHADYVHPDWHRLQPTDKIGAHIFYKAEPGFKFTRKKKTVSPGVASETPRHPQIRTLQ